jgi:hypothetical protein
VDVLTRRRVHTASVQSAGSDVTGSCGFSESVPASIRDIHKGLAVLAWFSWCQTKGDGTGANKEMWCRCLLMFCRDAVRCAGKCYRELIADGNVQLNTGVQVAADAGYFKAAVGRLLDDAVAGGLVGLDIVGSADTGNFVELLNEVRGECEGEVRMEIARLLQGAKRRRWTLFLLHETHQIPPLLLSDPYFTRYSSKMNEVEGSASACAFECVRGKVDGILEFSLQPAEYCPPDGSVASGPGEYVEQLVSFLRVTFGTLDTLSTDKREGFCFGCVGHIASRIMGFLVNGRGEFKDCDSGGVPASSKVNGYGMQNLQVDVAGLESFCVSTGVPQLKECMRELRCFADAMCDRDLGALFEDDNEDRRMERYPQLDVIKLKAVLEKYEGAGLKGKLKGMAGLGKTAPSGGYVMDKSEVKGLLGKMKHMR